MKKYPVLCLKKEKKLDNLVSSGFIDALRYFNKEPDNYGGIINCCKIKEHKLENRNK
jgi:exonuclease III